MNSVYKSIEIDLYSPTSYEVIKAQQGDKNSRILEFTLYNQGEPYVITEDISLKFMGHRGDGSYFLKDENDECISFKNNKIIVSLTDDVLYYSGMIEAKLAMYDNNGNVLSTVPFKISCIKSPCDENDLSKGERSKIEDLIFKVDEFYRNAEKTVSDAKDYAEAAYLSARNASTSENAASLSEVNAKESEKKAKTSLNDALESEQISAENAMTTLVKAAEADTYAKQAQSYAVGTNGEVRENDMTDCARHYYEQSRDISESLSGALKPMGTVTFAELIHLTSVSSGNMYNISDKFETTSTFKEGAGHTYPAGTNVYKTSDGYWDCLAGTMVTSVNGEKGDVTLTADDVGALPKTGGKLTGDVYPIGKSCLIAYPEDGSYIGTTASATGYCKIKLPVSWNNTMISFTVTIFNYTAGTSVEYRISGYNYNGNGGGWHQCTAVCIGKDGAGLSNLPVQFGHDGTNCAIYIGNASTNWSYPQVVVHDILIGYISDASLTYKKGWTISFTTTALSSVSTTISDTYIYKYTHPTTSGNKHIPSGGSIYQGLFYSSAGTAVWQYPNRLYGGTTGSTSTYCAVMDSTSFHPSDKTYYYSMGSYSYPWYYGYFKQLYEDDDILPDRYLRKKKLYNGAYCSTTTLRLSSIPTDFIDQQAYYENQESCGRVSSYSYGIRVRIIGTRVGWGTALYYMDDEVYLTRTDHNYYCASSCGINYNNEYTRVTLYPKGASSSYSLTLSLISGSLCSAATITVAMSSALVNSGFYIRRIEVLY